MGIQKWLGVFPNLIERQIAKLDLISTPKPVKFKLTLDQQNVFYVGPLSGLIPSLRPFGSRDYGGKYWS